MNTPKLLIADDHPLLRLGLAYALREHGFDVVAEAPHGQAALEMCQATRPDVALLDAKMPVMDGLAACAAIVAQHPSIKVAILTTFTEPALVQAARNAGACAFFNKETEASELARLLKRLLQEPELRFFPSIDLPEFTARELETLQHLLQGHSNKEMARLMGISPETIKDYVASIYRKLDTQDRMGTVARARALGLG